MARTEAPLVHQSGQGAACAGRVWPGPGMVVYMPGLVREQGGAGWRLTEQPRLICPQCFLAAVQSAVPGVVPGWYVGWLGFACLAA